MAETIITTNKPILPQQPTITGYTYQGNQIDINSDECLAKKYELTNGRTSYYIKTNLQHILFNPYDIGHKESLSRASLRRGSPMFAFREITKDGFDSYLEHLKNNSNVMYRRASRELITR